MYLFTDLTESKINVVKTLLQFKSKKNFERYMYLAKYSNTQTFPCKISRNCLKRGIENIYLLSIMRCEFFYHIEEITTFSNYLLRCRP